MKRASCIIFILLSLNASSQKGKIIGVLSTSETNLNLGGTKIKLQLKDSIVKETYTNESGNFVLADIPNGTYNLQIQQIGYRVFLIDSLNITDDSPVKLALKYPPDCIFNYLKGYKPKCIGGHTDNIIPIVYGLPTKKTMKKSSKGLVHLGGCIITDCDPKYFCTIHNREL